MRDHVGFCAVQQDLVTWKTKKDLHMISQNMNYKYRLLDHVMWVPVTTGCGWRLWPPDVEGSCECIE